MRDTVANVQNFAGEFKSRLKRQWRLHLVFTDNHQVIRIINASRVYANADLAGAKDRCRHVFDDQALRWSVFLA